MKPKPPASNLMRIRAYARRCNVSAPTIVAAIRTGKIRPAAHDHRGPLIDPKTADRTWRDKRVDRKRGALELVAIPRDPEEMDPAEAGKVKVMTSDGLVVPTFFQSKTLREHFAAKRAELEFEKAAGRLVDSEEVRRRNFKSARKARERLLAIPDRIAPVLAAETDAHKVHHLLAREIAEVCREIAADYEADEAEATPAEEAASV